MKFSTWHILPAVFMLILASCHPPLLSPGKSTSPQSDPISDKVHTAINQYRSTKGKQPLIRHNGLNQLAADHCRFLLLNSGSFSLHGNKVSHCGFENRALVARRRYSMDTLGENVAAGRINKNQAGHDFLSLWKNSKDHHHQLLEDWTHTGIGSVTGLDGTVYCTQIFATLNCSHLQSRDRFVPPR